MNAILYLILTLSLIIFAFSIGRYPFLNPSRNSIFSVSLGITILSFYYIFSSSIGLTSYEIFLLLVLGLVFFKQGRERKFKYGSLLFKKRLGDSIIRVEQNKSENTMIIKENGKNVLETSLSTGEPLSSVSSYPHLTELFIKPPFKILCIGAPTYAYASFVFKVNPRQSFDVMIENPIVFQAINSFFHPPKHKNFKLKNIDTEENIKIKKKYDLIFIDAGIVKSKLRQSKNYLLNRENLNFYKGALGKNGSLLINISTTLHKNDLDLSINALSPRFRTFKTRLIFVANGSGGKSQFHNVIHMLSKQLIDIKTLTKKLALIDEAELPYPKHKFKEMLSNQLHE